MIWKQTEHSESREVVMSKIGSTAIQKATTRTWDEWTTTLDFEGMQGKPHRDVVEYLIRTHELTPWWAQMVCSGYEQSKVQRVPQEQVTGFEISVSRTLEGSASDVFRAFNDPTRRAWCFTTSYTVRTTVAPRSLRLAMPDESLVTIAIDRKGNARCAVSVHHSKLPDAATAEQAKSAWRDALARLAGMLSD